MSDADRTDRPEITALSAIMVGDVDAFWAALNSMTPEARHTLEHYAQEIINGVQGLREDET